MSTDLVAGDDITLLATLYKDQETFDMSGASEVKAKVISLNKKTTYFPEKILSSGAEGADWANSLIAIGWSSADTAAVTYNGPALLEVQVTLVGKETFFSYVQISTGTIS